MKLTEALAANRVNSLRDSAAPLTIHIAAGFTVTSFLTFVTAFASIRMDDRKIIAQSGPYGDIVAAARSASGADIMIVVIDWADLDPRLGLRRYGTSTQEITTDILQTAQKRLDMLKQAVMEASAECSVVIVPPTMPLLPILKGSPATIGQAEVTIRRSLLAFVDDCLRFPKLVAIDPELIHLPNDKRRAAAAELGADMPYSLMHCSELADICVQAAFPMEPMKGLITDLDDTLWRGLVGEIGPNEVSWSVDEGTQMHAVYQSTLCSLAKQGILIGIASKNDEATAMLALSRQDLIFSTKDAFPIEINWGAKSESIARILEAWNIDQDSIVFVDDSMLEIAEVQARFPHIKGLHLRPDDEDHMLNLIQQLSHMFGRRHAAPEDALRSQSLRQGALFREQLQSSGNESDDFLKGLDSELRFAFQIDDKDDRPLDLINKTNQFNLNGRRLQAAEWRRSGSEPSSFRLLVTYSDKFGPLGKISVLSGTHIDRVVTVKSWVLSCRAFARRIEHAITLLLFDRFKPDTVQFEYAPTEKNAPIREFFRTLIGHPLAAEDLKIEIHAHNMISFKHYHRQTIDG